MPKDADLARALTANLNAVYTGKVKNIKFTYDAYIELDSLPADPVVFVTLETSPWIREARGTVRRDAAIRVTMISEVGPTDDPVWVEQYIDSFDSLIDIAMEVQALGLLPVDTETDDRYDVERFQSHHRLVMDTLLNYRNL